MTLDIYFEYEAETQRWIADLAGIPATAPIHVYGPTPELAASHAKQAALQALVWALETGEIKDLDAVIFTIHSPKPAVA
ncbi:MAG: hypothetical protein CVV27_13395 [Candidatus Melainabacteria bacterium HGW-Melainabacteria-1]|nr:MAG: hypothetical protein CVV27_13395 [Candidatus Melainabacteria bacterium HGW-Melainabacteria-1]